MSNYCLSSENCLRKMLVNGVGGEVTAVSTNCCSNCSGGKIPHIRTDVLVPAKSERTKRPPAVRVISEELRKCLQQQLNKAREDFMSLNPGFQMLGSSFVCPDSVICTICVNANFIISVDDLSMFFLRQQLRDSFFSVVMSTVCDAPPPKRRR